MKQKIRYLGLVFVFILIICSGCINKEIKVVDEREEIKENISNNEDEIVEEEVSEPELKITQPNKTYKTGENMRQFEIIKIKITDRIDVEIEFLDDRSRQRFVYPLTQGWEIEVEGEQKFIRNIKQRVSDGEFDKKVAEGIDISKIKKKYEGKKFK